MLRWNRGAGASNRLHHSNVPYMLTSFPIPRQDKIVCHTRDVTLENEIISMSLSLSSMSDNMTITHPPLSILQINFALSVKEGKKEGRKEKEGKKETSSGLEEGWNSSGLCLERRVWQRKNWKSLSRVLSRPVVLSECPWLGEGDSVLIGMWPAGLATAKVATRSVTLLLHPWCTFCDLTPEG